MNLKDVIAEDIDNVFFNTDDFSDEAIIDGRAVPIILDNDALNGKSDVYAMGLAEGEQLIFIKEKDMFRLPQPGEQMTINGKQWYIRHAISNAGVFELRIGKEQVYD
jgi:hypothetical protein